MRRFSHLVLSVYSALESMGIYADPLASAVRRVGFNPAFAAPYGFSSVGGYPRKDRPNTAAQVKRASIKARNVAKHRRTT